MSYDITSGSPIKSIWIHWFQIFKKFRMEFILLWLFWWVISSWYQRYANEILWLQDILKSIEQSISQKWPALLLELSREIWNATDFNMEKLVWVYGDWFNDLKNISPKLGLMWVLYLLLNIAVFIIIAYIVTDEITWNDSNRSKRIRTLFVQILPIFVTAIFVGLLNLTWVMFFIFPWIILWVYWVFTNMVMVHQKKYFIDAMKTSWWMVRWRWRKTFWVMMWLILSLIVIFGFIISILSFVLNIFNDVSIHDTWIQAISSILSVFMQIIMILFYFRWHNSKDKESVAQDSI